MIDLQNLGLIGYMAVPDHISGIHTQRLISVLCAHSRVDTDVLMEVAYSCNFLAVSDSSTCPDIGTS